MRLTVTSSSVVESVPGIMIVSRRGGRYDSDGESGAGRRRGAPPHRCSRAPSQALQVQVRTVTRTVTGRGLA